MTGKLVFILLLIIIAGGSFYYTLESKTIDQKIIDLGWFSTLDIKSSVIKNKQPIPTKYTCDGENISPHFRISGVPGDAKSLALVIEDPDAPDTAFVHWIVWNINPKTTKIIDNSLPAGAIQGINSFDELGYGGPCPPPSETHNYYFKLFALDTELNLGNEADKEGLEKAMAEHILDYDKIIAPYSREQ